MNLLIEQLNNWGERFLQFAWPMLWQSSLLILALFALDLVLRRKVRAGVRYALWLLVILKLLLPPTLALPTSIAWWIRPAPAPKPPAKQFVVTYSIAESPPTVPGIHSPVVAQKIEPAAIALSAKGWLVVGSSVISLGLLVWMMRRWWQVAQMIRRASSATGSLLDLISDCKRKLGMRRTVSLRLTQQPMSPAVCGLFRPVILLPRTLADQLPTNQLEAVLLHELVHLKRGDLWLNCVQALLQIVYWWHPMLWLANARIRRVREEAVDDAVMLALRDEAESYAPTLLEVAKLAFHRPLATLGLVGIMESRNSLRHRIERLVNFRTPRRAGVTVASTLGIIAFTALAMPMEKAPQRQVFTPDRADEPEPNLPQAKINRRPYFAQLNRVQVDPVQQSAGSESANSGRASGPSAVFVRDWVTIVAPLSTPDSDVRTNRAAAGKGRRDIVRKLDNIRLESVLFDQMPLSEVLERLNEDAKKNDPENVGVNFILAPRVKPGIAAKNDTDTSMAASVNPANSPDLRRLPITLRPALTNVRLADVLDALVRAAPAPIHFSIKEQAVVFSPRAPDDQRLYTRTYRVSAEAFYKALERNGQVTINRTNTAVVVRAFFANLGLDLNSESGKSIFFSEGKGLLLVRATQEELNAVERAIEKITAQPPRIKVEVKLAAISDFDPNAEPANSPLRSLPEKYATNGPLAEAQSRVLYDLRAKLRGDGRVEHVAPPTIQRVLNKPQAEAVVNQLQNRNGVDLLSAPSVITSNNRQAQIQVVDVQTIVVGVATNVTQGTLDKPQVSFNYLTEAMHFGSVVDILPSIEKDGLTINLDLSVNVSEFVGYDDPGKDNSVRIDLPGGKAVYGQRPLPCARLCQLGGEVALQDGQSVLLGGPVHTDRVRAKKKVPILGDIPLIGGLFRSTYSSTVKKHLIVLVTPTIVDPAGNPLHIAEQRTQ